MTSPGAGDEDGGTEPDGGTGPDGGTTGGSIPTVTGNNDFYVTSAMGTPDVDGESWEMAINGAVNEPATLTLDDLDALGAVEKEHTLACIGSSPRSTAVGNAVWSGRPLSEVLDYLGITPDAEAIELQFEGADTYQTALPISDLSDRPLWLVWEMNGEPLPPSHGYPIRLLVPDRYGMKNPKWITRLTFGTEPLLGFWESRGWSNDATYRPLCYFLSPGRGSGLSRGTLTTEGCAYAGSTAVTRVEVSTDGGSSWQEAQITHQGPVDTWTLWRFDWTPAEAGEYELLARIECADGRATNPRYESDLAGYQGYGTLPLVIT